VILVPLNRGYHAKVSNKDAWVLRHTWTASITKVGQCAVSRIEGKLVMLHRLVTGAVPGEEVDHRNGDRLDCQRRNLRKVSHKVNVRNMPPRSRRDNQHSPYRGVSLRAGKWRAYIETDGKRTYLGTHATAEEANAARLKAEKKAWGIQPRRKAAHA
jgi:hypothetical protein